MPAEQISTKTGTTPKYVQKGQPVEVALDPYPGQIFKGSVDGIWRANAAGQYLPSDVLPAFDAADPHQALGQYAVQIQLDDPDQDKFAIGAHSWLNWLYPLNV